MKRPLHLSLAIALALSGTDALALGLGTIHVNSKLNQPLDADIPILQGTAGEAEGLLVQLAAAEDFERVGLNRSRLSVPLEFSLIKGARGELSIKVTSKDVVREPFLDFLVEANWPKGRLLREYTVLLDPPVMAPATGTAVTSAAKTPERAPTQALPEARPKAAPPKPKAPPAAAAPRAEAPAKPAPAAPAPRRETGANEYTVEAGDTLSGIARDVRSDESTNINQLMLALLKQNPNAFYKDNINALKRGAILRIPTADQVKAVGSASEAAAQVHSQIEDWRGGAAAKPTLIADTGAAPQSRPEKPAGKPAVSSTGTSTAKAGSERLELVPPKAGKDSIAMADRPGSGAGSAAASGEIKAELARTKEALASRDQETGELKSRVKELEDTKSKTERLLSLKDSEIADLQRKLKELQQQDKTGAKTATASASTTPAATASSSTTPATPPATTPSTVAKTGDAKVSKEDIWGTATPDTKTAATSLATSPSGTAPAATSTSTPPAGSGTPPAATTGETPPGTAAGTAAGSSDATSTTPSASTTSPSSTASTTSPSSAATPSTGTGAATPETTSSATATPAPTKAASTTAALKPDAKTKTQPLPKAGGEWYEQSWVKPAAIGAGALLLLAALLGMRKRKVATPERASIAGAFGDTPIAEGSLYAATPSEAEEQALRDQLAQDPGNLGLHLELLSLLYAERNIESFEEAAEAMQAHVYDPLQPEWLEARAMGQELAPHNPLFADAAGTMADTPFDDEAVTAPHATRFDDDDVFQSHMPAAETPSSANTAFDFDLGGEPSAPSTPSVPASEAAFTFDSLPPLDFGKEAEHEMEAAESPAPLPVDEDEFASEDGVSTKLDLAKAYLDMGDPEGARSMLEEVLAEGNDTQRGEARKLMAELR